MSSSDDDDVAYDGDAPNTDENIIKCGTMEKVVCARNKGITFKVGWNERGQPIDPNSDMFTTFIIDDSCQRWVLKEASKLCRNFGTYFTKNNVYDENGSVNEHLPQMYPFISKEQWKAFVAKRQCNKFKLKEIGLKDTSISRHDLWKSACVNKLGAVDNENVKQVCKQLDTISQTTSHVQLQDSQDILSQALNVPEHLGRVRGYGFRPSLRDCFPSQKHKRKDDDLTLKEQVAFIIRKKSETIRE
ncbi:hypothetical protein JHK87_055846 [Glycine soja]|nr:hypothetical protein JHK87_055846 [Glycine soja]